MGGVNALNQHFREKKSVYLCVANVLRNREELKHTDSYDDADFVTKGPTRLKTYNDNIFFPVLTVQRIQNMSQPANIAPTAPTSELLSSHLVTSHLILHNTTPQSMIIFNDETTSFKQLEDVENVRLNWL